MAGFKDFSVLFKIRIYLFKSLLPQLTHHLQNSDKDVIFPSQAHKVQIMHHHANTFSTIKHKIKQFINYVHGCANLLLKTYPDFVAYIAKLLHIKYYMPFMCSVYAIKGKYSLALLAVLYHVTLFLSVYDLVTFEGMVPN